MIVQKEGETRLQYLTRVLTEYMDTGYGDGTIEYDGTECDGSCLADDFEIEVGTFEDDC